MSVSEEFCFSALKNNLSVLLSYKGMREEIYEHLTSLKKICEYSEDLDNQDTDGEHTKRYGTSSSKKESWA